ncbi:MAG TPA: hypothetical protein PLJ84_05885 [Bacteroidales bacterium]|nr:hypothetical protein [Bacteroidales bacterium]HPT02109.1 hypothetical protein [Bacteroidales bacterium]
MIKARKFLVPSSGFGDAYRDSLSVGLSLLITAITFPSFSLITGTGIDPPLSWIFNYFADGNWQAGKDIIFPHGPLAFLMYPLPGNLFQAVVFYSFIRFIFSWLIFKLFFFTGHKGFIIPAVTSFILLGLSDILLVMIGIVMIAGQMYFFERKFRWLFLAFAVTVTAVYIKAFAGIVCLSVTLAVIFILVAEILLKREEPVVLVYPLLFLLMLPLPWIAIYHTPDGFIRFINGNILLAGDNSAAAAMFPYNNWFFLGGGLVLMAVLTGLHLGDIRMRYFLFSAAPAVFAVWRYGIARQDYLHVGTWFLFVVMIAAIFVFLVNRKKLVSCIILAAGLVLFYLNSRNAYYYESYPFSVKGITFLNKAVFNYDKLADSCRVVSDTAIRHNRLDALTREDIGGASVDVYPWDYSFIPANGLNWQPRPVLQSYASYVPGLDRLNELHFRSEKAPAFLIWELDKTTNDLFDGDMESIDGRYLLNDEPHTLIALMERYDFAGIRKAERPVMLLKKRQTPAKARIRIDKPEQTGWERWLDIPGMKGDLLLARIGMHRSLAGDFRSYIYKDQPYYVYYQLDNGEVRFYRMVPANAADGIWINPLIMNPGMVSGSSGVKRIMFKCPDKRLVEPEIKVEWEHVSFSDTPFVLKSLPENKIADSSHLYVLESFFDAETMPAGWKVSGNDDKSPLCHSGKQAVTVLPGSYSPVFEINTSDISVDDSDSMLVIRAAVWTNTQARVEADLVISVDADGKPLLWKGVPVDNFQIGRRTWNYVYNFARIDKTMLKTKDAVLKVYLWNTGNGPFLADDMMVRIGKLK